MHILIVTIYRDTQIHCILVTNNLDQMESSTDFILIIANRL